VGTMGKPMALNLLKAGYAVTAYDVNPQPLKELKEKGATIGESIAEVASQTEVIITMLPNSADVETVILGDGGVIGAVKSGSIVVDMSTIDPSTSKKVAAALSEKGITMLDAPVSGGQWGAEQATLAIMVGGDEGAFKECSDIFNTMGKNITYCGANGSGEIVKIVNNLLAAVNFVTTAEALALGVKAGVKMEVLFNAINNSSGQNWAMQNYCPNKAFKGDFEPGFSVALHHKDVGLYMNLAKDEGAPVFVGSLIHQIYSQYMAAGLGGKDTTVGVKVVEDLLGVQLRLS